MVTMESPLHSPLRSPLHSAVVSKWGADAYAVLGFEPELVIDAVEDYYRANSAATTFADMVTHARTSNATMVDSDGVLKWAPHNLFVNSTDLDATAWSTVSTNVSYTQGVSDPDGGSGATTITATAANGRVVQTVSLGAVQSNFIFKVWVRRRTGTGTVTFEAPSVGVGQTLSLTSEWQLLTQAPIGAISFWYPGFRINTSGDEIDVYGAHLYRSDLGGMVANPDRGDSYVPTTFAAVYMPRRNHYRYNGTSWVKAGLLVEPTAATNLLLNSGTLSTQSATVTAAAHTLHFTGTGTITLSGVSTAGPLVGTGTGENNRVSLTFTPTAGSLTLTVTGTVTNAQLEAGSEPSSYIPTAGSTATRAAEPAPSIPIDKLPSSGGMPTAIWFKIKGYATFADQGSAAQFVMMRWYVDANNFITIDVDTDGAATGEINFNQSAAGTLDTVASPGTAYAPGINVPFSVASRHGATFINGAVDGTALTENATPVALADLSGAALQLAFSGGPFILSEFIAGTGDVTNAGIAEASA